MKDGECLKQDKDMGMERRKQADSGEVGLSGIGHLLSIGGET